MTPLLKLYAIRGDTGKWYVRMREHYYKHTEVIWTENLVEARVDLNLGTARGMVSRLTKILGYIPDLIELQVTHSEVMAGEKARVLKSKEKRAAVEHNQEVSRAEAELIEAQKELTRAKLRKDRAVQNVKKLKT